MGTFNFSLQQKVTTWMETEYEIEADTLEEAKQKAIQFHKERHTESIGWEESMDVQEPMTPEDNGGEPTEEIFDDEGNVIWNNTI
jgi:hypothetical protein